MTLSSTNYPTSPLSTSVTQTSWGTQSAQIASLSEVNARAIPVFNVRPTETPLLMALLDRGPDLNGTTSYDSLGIRETTSVSNFPEHRWREIGEENRVFNLSGNVNSVATTLAFASTASLRGGMVMRNTTTNEQIRITSVTNTTDVLVVRGFGSTPAAAITTTQNLVVLAVAGVGGSTLATAVGINASAKSNYFQKFENAISISDFDQMKSGVGQYDFANQLTFSEAVRQHKRDMEFGFLFGEKAQNTGLNTNNLGGVIEHARA